MPYETKIITQKHLMTVNCYLLKTPSGFILIDTGLSKRRRDLERELEAAGCGLGKLNLIVITHGHADHNGSTAYLREKYGARVAVHGGDSPMTESGDMFIGVKGLTVAIIRVLLPLIGMSRYDSFTPDISLKDGQDLSEYGFEAKAFHLPGHSQGSIGILTAHGDLFCGDTLVNNGKPARNTLIEDNSEYDASIEKLESLDVGMVYPGHGDAFRMEEVSDKR